MEDRTHLKKYMEIRDKTPKIRCYILWKDSVPENLPSEMQGKVFTWDQFIDFGVKKYLV